MNVGPLQKKITTKLIMGLSLLGLIFVGAYLLGPEQANISPVDIELLQPTPEQIVWGRERDVSFAWKFKGNPDQMPSTFEVEVSSDPQFSKIVAKSQAGTSSASLSLNTPGVYYWRVRGEGIEPAGNPVSSFSLYPLLAPMVFADATVEIDPDERGHMKNPMIFVWTDPSLSSSYDFQISDVQDFSRVVHAEETTKSRLLLPNLKVGTYYWRVTSRHPERADLVSKIGHLHIRAKDSHTPVTPDLESTEITQASNVSTKKKIRTRQAPVASVDLPSEVPTEVAASAPEDRPVEETLRLPELAAPPDVRRVYLYLGTGANYLSMEQISSDNTESGKYATLKGPTAIIGAQIHFNEQHSLELQYNSWPGEVRADPAMATLRENTFNWNSYLAEYQYQFSSQGPRRYSLLLGLQRHEIPFLSTAGDGVVDILQNDFMNGSLGFKVSHLGDSGWVYEAFLRYQHPLSAQSAQGYDFTTSPKMMFDGSLGVSRKFGEHLRVGAYWFGQYNSYDYTFDRDGSPVSGTQSLLNSNIQVRFGWEFLGILSVGVIPLVRRRARKKKPKAKSH
nr:hypothetical protein CKG001_18040 [Bdellovibrio sp. CKG001]BFD63061.1 hypothetical protein BdHM001_17420 [Bdellovibrio sp. HM001]